MTPRRLLAAGTLGSALVAVGGWGSGALPPGWEGRGPGTPLVLLGVLLLCGSWWWLRVARPAGGAAVERPAAARARRCSAATSTPTPARPRWWSRAWTRTTSARAPWTDRWPRASTTSGATSRRRTARCGWRWPPSSCGSPATRCSAAVAGMRLLAVLGLVLAGWGLHRLGGERALWLGVANPLVLLHLVAGAHNEALMLGLAVAGLAVTSLPARRGAGHARRAGQAARARRPGLPRDGPPGLAGPRARGGGRRGCRGGDGARRVPGLRAGLGLAHHPRRGPRPAVAVLDRPPASARCCPAATPPATSSSGSARCWPSASSPRCCGAPRRWGRPGRPGSPCSRWRCCCRSSSPGTSCGGSSRWPRRRVRACPPPSPRCASCCACSSGPAAATWSARRSTACRPCWPSAPPSSSGAAARPDRDPGLARTPS